MGGTYVTERTQCRSVIYEAPFVQKGSAYEVLEAFHCVIC
jgi:hypothetical protein